MVITSFVTGPRLIAPLKQFEKKLSLLKISEMAEVPLTYEKAGTVARKTLISLFHS